MEKDKEQKVLEFKVYKDGEALGTPRWREAVALNAQCPEGHQMTVINAASVLYAHCHYCDKYYIAE